MRSLSLTEILHVRYHLAALSRQCCAVLYLCGPSLLCLLHVRGHELLPVLQAVPDS